MKKIMFSVLVTTMLTLGARAQQQLITTSMDLPEQPMTTFAINSDGMLSEGAKVTFHWQCFDDGQRTAIIHIDWPEFLEQYKQGRPNAKELEFSYSGKQLHLMKHSQGGKSGYVVLRDKTVLAGIVPFENKGKMITAVQINTTENCHLIDDIYLGMNVDELKDLTSRTMKHSSVKFLYKEGTNKVYDVLWLGMRDTYKDFEGTQHAEVHAKEPYGRFWFDASGKLVKWYAWSEGSNM